MPKFERKEEIDAPVEKVWEVITNPQLWPQWFPGFDSVSATTPISKGSKFEWMDDGKKGTGTIKNLEPGKRLEILTQVGEDQDLHVFTLKASGGFLGLANDECTVDYTFDTLTGGGILSAFLLGGNPKDMLKVKKALHLLRRLVESK